ncbi:hypothetical protein YC2023_066373 [Brassica napus]
MWAVCSVHTGRPWVSVNRHITSMCVRQHKQDVRGFPCVSVSTHRTSVVAIINTGRPWVSASTHRTSVAVRVCPSVSVSTHRMSVAVHQYTYQHVVHTGRPWVSPSTHRTSVAVCGYPSAHTGHPWLSISTHINTLVLGLSMLALPVDCLGDFSPRGLSVQYTQDVYGCPPAHTGCSWLSVTIVSTHRTSVAVCVCPCVSVSTRWTSMGVRQHTQDVSVCPWLSVCVRVCLSAHTECLWLSISTHISTLVLGLSMLALPVDCLGDFGQRGLSVQYTHGVHGCLPTHTGRLRLSVSTHRTSVAVSVCPCVSITTDMMSVVVHQYTYEHAGPWTQPAGPSRGLFGTSVAVRVCLCVSVSTHRTSFAVHQYTYQHVVHTGRLWVSASIHRTSVPVRVCPFVSVSTHRRSVAVHQYTYQHVVHTGRPWVSPSTHRTSVAVRGNPSAHTGRQWLSVCVRVCSCDFGPRGCPWQSVSTHRTLVLGLSTLTLPVDYSGDFGPRGLVCSVHTRRPWVSASTHRTFVAVRVCPSVSVSTHRTSVAVHQYTYQHVGSLTQHAALPVDNLGDFGPRGLSVQYTQDVRWCPPAHRGRPWLSVAIRQHTRDVRGCMCVSVCVGVCSSAHTGRPWVSVSTYKMSVGVRVWPSAHTGRLWLSISTHNSTLVLGLSTLGLPVDCLGDFGPRGQSVQYTQGVRGCLPAHTGCPRLSVSTHKTSVAVCVCPCVSTTTHRMSVAVHQYTYQHAGPSRGLFGTHRTSVAVLQYTYQHVVHTGHPWVSASTHRTSVAVRVCPSVSVSTHKMTVALHQYTYQHYTQDVRGCPPAHTGRPWLSVAIRQHTQDVCGCLCVSVCVRVCPSAHTRRLWVSVSTHRMSVGVRVCPSAHTGRPWLSISTHNSTLVLGLSTLAFPVDCLGDFGLRGQSVQYTHDVCGCPPAHIGRLWLSVSTHRTSVAVCICLCVSVCVLSTHRTSVAIHQYTYQHAGPWTQHAGRSRGLFGTSVCVRQHTQDVRVCPSAHTGRPFVSVHTGRPCVSVSTHRTSVAVCVCTCVSVSTHRTSVAAISTHISTLVLGLSMLALPVDCLGDFGPRGLSVQYTQGVRGCLPAHIGRPRLSDSTNRTSVAVCVCQCVSITTHRMSVAVHQYIYQHAGPSRGLFGTHRTSVAVRVCLCVSVSTHRTSVAVHQYTYQHVVHTGRPWVSASTHKTSVAVHQYTYQHVGPLTQHAGPSIGLFG